MKREVLELKIGRQKRRTQFLFNDGEFRPKTEVNRKQYRRNDKHRGKFQDYEERFYL